MREPTRISWRVTEGGPSAVAASRSAGVGEGVAPNARGESGVRPELVEALVALLFAVALEARGVLEVAGYVLPSDEQQTRVRLSRAAEPA